MKLKANILLIDDEQVVIDSLKKICSFEGHSVKPALTAESGLSLIDKENFDLTICDIMLPEMDGFEFLEELKSRNIKTPVIITTGYSTVENAVNSLHQGAIDYIPKPFTIDEVLSSLQRALNLIELKDKVTKSESGTITYVECPANYYRLGFGSWMFIENKGSALIGVTDLYLKIIGEFDSMNLKEEQDELIQGTGCAKFFSTGNFYHDLLSPLSGKVIEVNKNLSENSNIIEKDPFFEGWLYRIIPSDIEYEMKNLTSCGSKEL